MLIRIDVYRRIKALRVQMERQVQTPEDLHSPEVLRLSRSIDKLILQCYEFEPVLKGRMADGGVS